MKAFMLTFAILLTSPLAAKNLSKKEIKEMKENLELEEKNDLAMLKRYHLPVAKKDQLLTYLSLKEFSLFLQNGSDLNPMEMLNEKELEDLRGYGYSEEELKAVKNGVSDKEFSFLLQEPFMPSLASIFTELPYLPEESVYYKKITVSAVCEEGEKSWKLKKVEGKMIYQNNEMFYLLKNGAVLSCPIASISH